MISTPGYLEIDNNQLRRHNFIDGLFLMGSRSEGESYRTGESDIDCCIVVTQPIQYKELYDIVSRAILENAKVELCPRTVSQLQARSKFNYDLKYLSKVLYIQELDTRKKIPLITLRDFSKVDIYSTLSSSLDFFMTALREYFKNPTNLPKVILLLEKSLRKLSLFLNLQHGNYPIKKGTRYKVIFDIYFNQGLWLSNLSFFRENLNYKNIDINHSFLALSYIIKAELQVLSNTSLIDLDFIANTIADKEHFNFTKSVLEIFFQISHELSLKKKAGDILDLNRIGFLLNNDYQSLIAQDHFIPPDIINGGYHVFK